MPEITMSAGVFGLLAGANSSRSEGYRFYMDGDLHQMSVQEEFLRRHDFDVGRNNVYPCLRTQEDFDKAIKMIYDGEVEGWWHYDRRLIEINHCTQEQFSAKLDAYCARRKH